MERQETIIGSAEESRLPVQEVVDTVMKLPFETQMGILRALAPQIIGCLEGEQRDAYVRDLNEEIAKVAGGAPTLH